MTTQTNTINQRAPFDYVTAMTNGHTYNKYVAHVLQSFGITCVVPELEIAQTQNDIDRMTVNEKDLILPGGQCLEIKSRNLQFTDNPASFPYHDLLVDTVTGYDAKAVKPLAYVFVSQKTKQMFTLPTRTYLAWQVQTKYDHERQQREKFYTAAKSLCLPLSALVTHLRQQAAQ
jgi:hypothetical protein